MPYTVLTINTSTTDSFTALANQGDVSIPTNRGSVPGFGIMAIAAPWVWGRGIKPAFETGAGQFQAAGSTIIVQRIPADSGNPQIFRCILLEGSAGATFTLSDQSDSREVAEGDYVDVVMDETPYIGEGGTFDGDNTAGSEGLISAINTAKAAENIP